MSKSISKLNVQVTGDARPLDKTIASTKKKLDTLAPTTNGLSRFADDATKSLAKTDEQARKTLANIDKLKKQLPKQPGLLGNISGELAENALGGLTGGKIAKMLGGVGLAAGGPLALLGIANSFMDNQQQLKSREDYLDMGGLEVFARSIPLLGSFLGDFTDNLTNWLYNTKDLKAMQDRIAADDKQMMAFREKHILDMIKFEEKRREIAEQGQRTERRSLRRVEEMNVGGREGRTLAVNNERRNQGEDALANRDALIYSMRETGLVNLKTANEEVKRLSAEAAKLKAELDKIEDVNSDDFKAKEIEFKDKLNKSNIAIAYAEEERKNINVIPQIAEELFQKEIDAIAREANKKMSLIWGTNADTKGIMDAFEDIQNSIDGLSIDNFDAMIKEFKKLNPLEKDLEAFRKKIDELREATEAMDKAKEAEANRKNSYKQALEDFKRFQLESARIDKQIEIEKERNALKRIEAEIRADGEAQKAKLKQAGVVGKEYDDAAKKIDESTEKTVKQQLALERQRKANSIKDSNMTPTEQLKQQLDEIGDLLTNGFLSEADARKAVENATNGLIQAQASPNQDIMLAGSGEAQKAAFIASGQVLDGSNPMLAQQKKTNEILNDIRDNGKLDNSALISF